MGLTQKNPGGRPKGARNKATKPIRDAIIAKDPIGRLFELAAEARERGDHEFEHKVMQTILPYGLPRLTASTVDLEASLMGNVTLEVNLTPQDAGDSD